MAKIILVLNQIKEVSLRDELVCMADKAAILLVIFTLILGVMFSIIICHELYENHIQFTCLSYTKNIVVNFLKSLLLIAFYLLITAICTSLLEVVVILFIYLLNFYPLVTIFILAITIALITAILQGRIVKDKNR